MCWIEGKLFNSTYDTAVAKGYIEVGNRMCAVMEQLAQRGEALGTVSVTNLYRMLNGEDTEISTSAAAYLRDGDAVAYDDEDESEFDDGSENGEGGTWCSSCNEFHYD